MVIKNKMACITELGDSPHVKFAHQLFQMHPQSQQVGGVFVLIKHVVGITGAFRIVNLKSTSGRGEE